MDAPTPWLAALSLADAAPTSAYQAGYIAGVVIAVAILLGILGFGVVAVIMAFVKRTTGWIIAGAISSVIFLGAGILLMTGFVKGFKQGYANARARRAPAGAVATAGERITGQALPFTIEQPVGWEVKRKQMAYDIVLSQGSDFIGVIAEEADLGSVANVAEIARKQIGSVGTETTFSEDESITLDGRTWTAFTVKCKVQNLPFAYQYYVYTGKEGTIQIMGWTFQNLWDRESVKLREIMQSFRFPPATATAP